MIETTRALFHRLWTKAVGTPDYVKAEWRDLEAAMKAATAPPAPGASSPDDLRALGWTVAVHNDYRLGGDAHTFWLLTHSDGHWLKGEGRTDAEALDQIRSAIRLRTL